jgi:hypothetical protein
VEFGNDLKEVRETGHTLLELEEGGEKPRFGFVGFVITPCEGFHGVPWDAGADGFLALVLSLGHAYKLFSLD